MTPREFFEAVVLRSFNEWRAFPLDKYLAMTAIGHANVMAERMWYHYKDVAPHRVYCASRAERYRSELADVCPDFALVRDVAEAFKHVELGRPSRQVTFAEQARYEPTVWGAFSWGLSDWGGQIVVECDDGNKRDLRFVLQNVVELWDRLTSAP